MAADTRADALREVTLAALADLLAQRKRYVDGTLEAEHFAKIAAEILPELAEARLADRAPELDPVPALDPATWEGIRDPGWLVERLIPDDPCLAVLYGQPGAFKSFIALDLCLAIASRGIFLPPKETMHGGFAGVQCNGGRVLYIVYEDSPARVRKRFEQVRERRQVTSLADGCAFDIHFIHPFKDRGRMPFYLSDDRARRELMMRVTTEGYNLIVLDTLAQSVRDVDENSSRDMTRVVDWAHEIRDIGGSVLFIHHTRKRSKESPEQDSTDPAEMRGSTALHGAADVLLASSVMNAERHQIRFVQSKSRDIEEHERLDAVVEAVPEDVDVGPRARFLWVADMSAARATRRKASIERRERVRDTALALFHAEGAQTGEEIHAHMIERLLTQASLRTIKKDLVALVKAGALAAHRKEGRGLVHEYHPPAD